MTRNEIKLQVRTLKRKKISKRRKTHQRARILSERISILWIKEGLWWHAEETQTLDSHSPDSNCDEPWRWWRLALMYIRKIRKFLTPIVFRNTETQFYDLRPFFILSLSCCLSLLLLILFYEILMFFKLFHSADIHGWN